MALVPTMCAHRTREALKSRARWRWSRGGSAATVVLVFACLTPALTSCGNNASEASSGRNSAHSRSATTAGSSTSAGSSTTAGSSTPGGNSASDGMATPVGYTQQQLIFDDRFTGASLDSSNWNTYLGAQGIAWNDHGNLPAPYSGPNAPITNEAAMFGPSQVSVDNGLTLTAVRNTDQYAGTFPWISGVITTEGKFTLPTTGWYVQVRAKMPDVSQGMWPAIWFLPPTAGTPYNEFDGYEGGWLLGNSASPNEVMHSDYFSNQGQQQTAYSVNTDLTAGYNIYGYQYIPGQSVTAYFDGTKVWQVSAASGITITAEPYEIIIELQADHRRGRRPNGGDKYDAFGVNERLRGAGVLLPMIGIAQVLGDATAGVRPCDRSRPGRCLPRWLRPGPLPKHHRGMPGAARSPRLERALGPQNRSPLRGCLRSPS